ncbi:Cu/Zn superoxide dismutase [Coprinopsis marcescibilis]|uniref:Superoxide dismutase [Cu-Zn] n=1 Tax=Coprinopsis marcescibilis TaxID=230819 RepID=A0A5C3L5X8_COPMA|nr:Cu/Zn superoxide dismutase [Coprinopsis marcescibilis]
MVSPAYGLFWHPFIPQPPAAPLVTKAVVVLSGAGTAKGTVYFQQATKTSPVKITGELTGLDANSLRGFHVHQAGDLTNGCASAGPHYNPLNRTHGAPTSKDRHVGDLGNIKTNETGVAILSFEDRLISLNGAYSIIGRAVVLHAGTDDLGLGGNQDSLTTGNAGGRAACGVIALTA